MGAFDFLNFKKRKKEKEIMHSYESYPALLDIKAREKYVFHSDYFKIDDYYASILMFRHQQGARDGYGPFWGVNMIPNQLPKGVTTMNFDQVSRMGEGWLAQNQNRTEQISQKNAMAQAENGTLTTRAKAQRTNQDLAIIAQELNDGASYLNVKSRLLVKAPSLKVLEQAIAKIEREYTDRFGTLDPAVYNGRQKRELFDLFAKNEAKYGHGFYYTSTEFAGNYNLVTHGLEDPGGEYVGYMQGDVNNSAVLFDSDNFGHHAVIASDQYNNDSGIRQHVTDMWGLKLAQAALLDNHRVVHIVLNSETNLAKLGPTLKNLTYTIDMSHGDVNMFEMFGKTKDELSIFARQMQKLVLMTEQAYEPTPADKSIIENYLQSLATEFYVDQNMWFPDAQNHRDKLRVVGIPHEDVPKLELFASYLDMAYKREVNGDGHDAEQQHAANVLRGVFQTLLSNNGDLFNTTTTHKIDGVVSGRRVIYDFGQLMIRGKGIAMAQLVNIFDYAVSTLSEGDLLIIHGAEKIDPGIRKYCNQLFDQLYDRGARIVFLYNDITKFLDDQDFNRFDQADYTILGNMTANLIDRYQSELGSTIPADLAALLEDRSQAFNYIRRGTSNVVFVMELPLQPSKADYGLRKRRHY